MKLPERRPGCRVRCHLEPKQERTQPPVGFLAVVDAWLAGGPDAETWRKRAVEMVTGEKA